MGRIRTIKPEFFKHEQLFDLEQEKGLPLRLAFAGLWTLCDREGRFVWRPRTMKVDVLPYDGCDFSLVLDALLEGGFLQKYTVDGKNYGCIPSWPVHQVVNNREATSLLPSPEGHVPSRSTGFVYLAISPSLGKFKIGYAEHDPQRRVHDLSCGSAEELEFVEAVAGPRSLENEIHQALKDCSNRREWFVCCKAAARVLDAWFSKSQRVVDAGQGEGKGREKEGKGSDVITPEMITRGVLSELGLSGRELAVVLDEVCRSQVKIYESPGALRDALIESWRQYDAARPSLAYTTGAAKFFGDGVWRNKTGWPWKEGKQPPANPNKPVTLLEKIRQQEAS